MNRLIVAVVVSASLCASLSCARKDGTASSISETIRQRETLEGKRVLVRGYIEVDVLDSVNFVEERGPPVGDRIRESLDLWPPDDRMARKIAGFDGSCVLVDGTLRLYGPRPRLLPVAGLGSKYGLIDVRAIRECDDEHT